jgi:hypothetical protein
MLSASYVRGTGASSLGRCVPLGMCMFSTAVATLLEANGLTEVDMASGGAAQITHLEMFLHEYPKVGGPRCRRDVAVLFKSIWSPVSFPAAMPRADAGPACFSQPQDAVPDSPGAGNTERACCQQTQLVQPSQLRRQLRNTFCEHWREPCPSNCSD